jgi:hypothetical protein
MSFLGFRNAVSIGVSPHATLGGPNLLNKLSPSLLLNFAGAETLDPRITFTRASTATFTGSDGLIQTAAIDTPRFDYNPTTLAPLGLLIEEQRVNLFTYSDDFSNASWIKQNMTLSTDVVNGPDNATMADKLIMNSGIDPGAGNQNGLRKTQALTAGSYTYSIFAKAAEFDVLRVRENSETGGLMNLNLTTGAITIDSFAIAQFERASAVSFANGWWRLSWTSKNNMSNMDRYCIRAASTGNGTSGFFIWGAQLEAGEFPTSYIPTEASQVTRSADAASMTGTNFSSWYNAAEGTLFAEYSAVASGIRTINALNDGTDNESIRLRTNATNPLFTVTDGGVDQADVDAGTVASNIVYKFAGAYMANSFAASISGGAAVTDTSGTLPTVDRAMLGNSAANNYLNGYLRKIAYYPRRLSNAELQRITL